MTPLPAYPIQSQYRQGLDMALSIKTFAQYVRDMSAAVQGATSQILDLSVGSVIRAILEANASIALWLPRTLGLM